MPFTRVVIPFGVSADEKQAFSQAVHRAMVEAIGFPRVQLNRGSDAHTTSSSMVWTSADHIVAISDALH